MSKRVLETENLEPLATQDKQRAREQWSQDPCGAESDRDSEFGTRRYFDEVERVRYQEYAPWMPELMGFNSFAGARLLEVGCGMGTDLLQFARGGAHCTGIDLTPRSIAIRWSRPSITCPNPPRRNVSSETQLSIRISSTPSGKSTRSRNGSVAER